MKCMMRAAFVSLLGLLASACGGGSNDDDDEVGNGVFLDSPVSGISYRTASIAGVTDATGAFRFVPGENVTFAVGSVSLPPVAAAAVVTPADIAGVADTQAAIEGSQEATNILRFLQTLDEDGNPDNGIVIDPAAIEVANGETLNFSAATATFEDAFEDVFGTTLIPIDQAIAHFVRQVIPLAGDWRVSSLTLGFDSASAPTPYEDSTWEKTDLAIAPDGSFTGDTTDSTGHQQSFGPRQFSLDLLDETGELSIPAEPDFFAAIDAGKTVFANVGLDDGVGGGENWAVSVRRSDIVGYDQTDLMGTWRAFDLAIAPNGTDSFSNRSVLSIQSAGNYTFTSVQTYIDGSEDPNSGTGMFSLSADGTVNEASAPIDLEGVLDAGKSVISYVNTDVGVQAGVLLKQGAGYETSDLRGIWQNFVLTVFEDGSENYQQRGRVCIENDGSYVATDIESGGDTSSGPGTFVINGTTGVVTESGHALNGALDAGKTVLAYVDQDDEDATDVGLQVGVLIKTNFLPVTFTCP